MKRKERSSSSHLICHTPAGWRAARRCPGFRARPRRGPRPAGRCRSAGSGCARPAAPARRGYLDHRQQHLAQDFGLRADLGRARAGGEAGDTRRPLSLVQAAHQRGVIAGPKRASISAGLEFLPGCEQQRGHARLGVQTQRGRDQRGTDRGVQVGSPVLSTARRGRRSIRARLR